MIRKFNVPPPGHGKPPQFVPSFDLRQPPLWSMKDDWQRQFLNLQPDFGRLVLTQSFCQPWSQHHHEISEAMRASFQYVKPHTSNFLTDWLGRNPGVKTGVQWAQLVGAITLAAQPDLRHKVLVPFGPITTKLPGRWDFMSLELGSAAAHPNHVEVIVYFAVPLRKHE